MARLPDRDRPLRMEQVEHNRGRMQEVWLDG